MIYLWVLLIFMLIAALFIFQPRSPRFYNYLYEMKIIPVRKKLSWQGIKNGAGEIKKIPFLQVLIVIFFIQWLMGIFIEFQYTKVVDEGINASNGAQHAQGLLQGLGALQIIFFSSALIVQLLLASRIMKFLGTIGGFLFHALVTFMSTLTMMLGFGYFTAVMAKNNYEVSGIVSRNAYEASYYAFRHGTQKTLREFFEGLVAPAGTIMGTILLLIIRMFFGKRIQCWQ